MTQTEKDAAFDAIIADALKKMQTTVTTAGSSSYEVYRSSGELVIQRSDKAWTQDAVRPPVEKKVA